METLTLKKGESTSHSEELGSCSIGLTDNDLNCNTKGFYGEKIGFKFYKDFDQEEQELLSQRSSITFSDDSRICFQHEKYYLKTYEIRQKYCCNPFSKENHNIKKSLRVINFVSANKLTTLLKRNIKPGQKWCTKCRKEFDGNVEEESSTICDQDIEIDDPEDVNTSLQAIGLSPLKFQKISKRDTIGYTKRKVKEAQEKIVSTIMNVGGVSENSILEASLTQTCSNCKDYIKLLDELIKKCQEVTLKEKVQILTLAPKSWSIKKTAEEFKVSTRTVRDARKFEVLAMPNKKRGNVLSEVTKECVKNFFEDDEFSRICPGKKDYVTVRADGDKIQMQKRLLLCNLKEMYKAYKERNQPKIGFSMFCHLRPKWCVTVGSSGMHSVCVCIIHQNVKLMIAGSNIVGDYKTLIKRCVCDMESKECMLHRCEECPGEGALKEYLADFYKDNNPEEIIEFKQWLQTDRHTLDRKQLSIEDFVNELSSKIWNLSNHHYISKHQSSHLRAIKDKLKIGELVILMDFSENYNFVVQDAVQGFHWENSQATLHPFAVYYVEEKLQCASICIISDCLRHDTVVVHISLVYVIEYLKKLVGEIKYIYYFSDGSVAQYKNYKNFINLCHHEKDFGMPAEWNFFATSHGKSPCDGIGGVIKRQAARTSLQRPLENQILTPYDLFSYCNSNISGIKTFYIPKEEVEIERKIQEERFKCAHTVAGTRDNHHFVPIDENKIRVSKVSNDTTAFVASIRQHTKISSQSTKFANLQPGQYIACIYDNEWWIGNICEVSFEHHDVLVKFMRPHGPSQSFYWPKQKDFCWVPEVHIITTIPASTTLTRKKYTLLPANKLIIEKGFSKLINLIRA